MAKEIDALRAMIEKSLDLIEAVGNRHNPYKIRVLEMFSSVFDMTKDALMLMDGRRFLLVPLCLRSIMDTIADLKLLQIDPENVSYLEAQRIKREIGMKQYQVDQNPSILDEPHSPEDIEFASSYKDLVLQFEDLKARNYTPLSERAKFQKAGMIDLYRTFFLAFSMESHNNPAALDARHLVKDETGKLLVLFDRTGSDTDLEMWCSLVAILYVESTRVVTKVLHSQGKAMLNSMMDIAEPFISKKYESVKIFLRSEIFN